MNLPAVPLTRWQALFAVVLIWAAIYLPGLGSLELKGEEGRRVMPGVTMLETGRWIVPQMGGVDYLAKPPLINWLAAAAFSVARDTRSEWAARTPSVLAVLALGLFTVGALSRWLTPGGALVAAIFELTNIGLMEKGRLAEIEALYLSLTGIAIVLWLGAWQRDVSERAGKPSWSTWTFPWLALGLGLLTKGPLHLGFFYAVVAGVLICSGRRRDWLNLPHLVGVILMLAIFAAWGIPYLQQTAHGGAGDVWLEQFRGRMEVNEKFHLATWALNIPRGLANFIPWTVLLPLAFRKLPSAENIDQPTAGSDHSASPSATRHPQLDLPIARGLRWSIALCFLVISLAPGGQPRYTLPLLAPASVLLALVVMRGWRTPVSLPIVWQRFNTALLITTVLAAPIAFVYSRDFVWGRWTAFATIVLAGLILWQTAFRRRAYPFLAFASAIVMALLTADYAIGAIPLLAKSDTVRPAARDLDLAVDIAVQFAAGPAKPLDDEAARTPVTVLRPGFLPFLFYVHHPIRYIQNLDFIPVDARFLLVREDLEKDAAEAIAKSGRTTREIARVGDKRVHETGKNQWALLQIFPSDKVGL